MIGVLGLERATSMCYVTYNERCLLCEKTVPVIRFSPRRHAFHVKKCYYSVLQEGLFTNVTSLQSTLQVFKLLSQNHVLRT